MNQNEQTDDEVGVFVSHGSNLSHSEQDDGHHGEHAYDRVEHSLKEQLLSHQCMLFAFENGVSRRRHCSYELCVYTVGAVLERSMQLFSSVLLYTENVLLTRCTSAHERLRDERRYFDQCHTFISSNNFVLNRTLSPPPYRHSSLSLS